MFGFPEWSVPFGVFAIVLIVGTVCVVLWNHWH